MFELHPNAPMSSEVANSIAIALREALARRLGVESAEIGYSVKIAENLLDSGNKIIGLYDKPSGGAGYATDAEENFGDLINQARLLLDCPEECDHACSACILTHDAPSGGSNQLDRHGAIKFMDDELVFTETLSTEEDIYEDTRISNNLIKDINRVLKPGGTVAFFLDLNDPGSLPTWSLNSQIERWVKQNKTVLLVAENQTISSWTGTQKLLVRDWISKTSVVLATGKRPLVGDEMTVVAHIRNAGDADIQWIGKDPSIVEASMNWPMSALGKILYGTSKTLSLIHISEPTRPY